nr:hypothetical protein [Tanacetum cinerariifolium]
MRPFGCLVTILNTLDSLGKFYGKVDEGFLVGYSMSSKAFRVFNSRTRIVQETLHINFLENTPNVAASGPTWLFDIDTLTKTMKYQPVTAGNQSNPSAGNTDGDASFEVKEPEFEGRKPESEGKSPIKYSTRYRNLSVEFEYFSDNIINEDNAAGSLVHAVGQLFANNTNTFSTAGPSNAAVKLDDITYSDDEYDVGAEANFNNLETSITVSPISTTRVHKDHPVTQIIGDLSSATQTRSMTRVAKDQGGLSQINNDDFHTCMFVCFLSQKEPKRKRAIGTKWAFRNKKDERGIVVRNKARLVAQGHTQEERINYEEVFAPVARIEAIRLFLAYASFMGFMVYQIDVKSAFLYGTIKEEVYVCQHLGFEGFTKWSRLYMDYIKLLELDGKSASTSIDTEKPLLKDPDGEDVDVHTYKSMIGSLMYLTLSRPSIMFAVCACAHFQVTPKALHLHAVKRIYRYLKDQTVSGKDSSNSLMADNLPKIVWYSSHHVAPMKSWLVQKQTALGKDESNSFIVDSLLKTIW